MKSVGNALSKLTMIAINVLILVYVLNLEKDNCECSSNWKRDFIKYFTSILIGVNVLGLLVPNLRKKRNRLLKLVFGLLGLANLVNIGVLVAYYIEVHEKLKNGCECSRNWKRHLMLVPVVTLGLLVTFFMLVTIMRK